MSKYHNKKVTIDGRTFDSMAEAAYYQELKLRLKAGDIRGFGCQSKISLLPGFEKYGRKIRPVTYIADFIIEHKDGSIEYIDVKGMETEVFKLKRKMFDYFYPEETLTIVRR